MTLTVVSEVGALRHKALDLLLPGDLPTWQPELPDSNSFNTPIPSEVRQAQCALSTTHRPAPVVKRVWDSDGFRPSMAAKTSRLLVFAACRLWALDGCGAWAGCGLPVLVKLRFLDLGFRVQWLKVQGVINQLS